MEHFNQYIFQLLYNIWKGARYTMPQGDIMNQNLMPILTNISKMPIHAFQFDTKNDRIKVNFSKNDFNEVNEIIFDQVTSFYYKDHDGQENDYSHENINSIMYCGHQPYELNLPEDDDMMISIPNFIIELNDSNIFIEAQSIVINKEQYKV